MEIKNYDKAGDLLIGIDKNHLADLILNFLGKKEVLSYEAKKSFILRLNDIEQFYYLLESEIAKEQYNSLGFFSVTFLFNDNTKRTINNIESLNKYLETRDVEPISVTLQWHVVVSFPNSENIETQKIEVSFEAIEDNTAGNILVNIEHTNQAWGIEVLNLIKDKILLVSKDIPKNSVVASRVKDILSFKQMSPYFMIISLAFFLLNGLSVEDYKKANNLAVFNYYLEGNIDKNEFEKYDFISSSIDESYHLDVYKKAVTDNVLRDFLTKSAQKRIEMKSRNFNMLRDFCVSLLIFWIVIYFYLTQYIKYNTNKSFILTTSRAKNCFEEYTSLKRKMGFYSISLTVFTISTGLLINLISSYF